MKVIKSEVKHDVRQVTCPKCKSVLEYDERDVMMDLSEWVRTGNDSFVRHYVKCPECNTNIHLEISIKECKL